VTAGRHARHRRGVAALAALLITSGADAALWKCQSRDGVIYTNDPRTTQGKRCEALALPSASATPPRPGKAAATAPSTTPRTALPRDDLRRQILTHEHQQEAAAIAELEQQLAAAPPDARTTLTERLNRHRKNLEAIARELQRLR
jgi:hypothetical protein